jgi:hypothetical protein
MLEDVLRAIGRFFLHIYRTLLNRYVSCFVTLTPSSQPPILFALCAFNADMATQTFFLGSTQTYSYQFDIYSRLDFNLQKWFASNALLVSNSSNVCAAWRIDPSIRPPIKVKELEEADHVLFDITFVGVLIQCIFAVLGYSWMYAFTRRTKLSVLAALPPFLLNILYAGTHNLYAALDVFVSFIITHFTRVH